MGQQCATPPKANEGSSQADASDVDSPHLSDTKRASFSLLLLPTAVPGPTALRDAQATPTMPRYATQRPPAHVVVAHRPLPPRTSPTTTAPSAGLSVTATLNATIQRARQQQQQEAQEGTASMSPGIRQPATVSPGAVPHDGASVDPAVLPSVHPDVFSRRHRSRRPRLPLTLVDGRAAATVSVVANPTFAVPRKPAMPRPPSLFGDSRPHSRQGMSTELIGLDRHSTAQDRDLFGLRQCVPCDGTQRAPPHPPI